MEKKSTSGAKRSAMANCGGHLHHDAHLDFTVKGHTLGVQFLLDLLQNVFGLHQFTHPGDEREHDAHLAPGRGAQDGGQLVLEKLLFLQAEADGP